eukprot:Tbor_TRINITY_DN928_c0_g1::TRINITY_DN928_c0_g1_i1::g.21166::m.21166
MSKSTTTPRNHSGDLNSTAKSLVAGNVSLSATKRGTVQEPQETDTQVAVIRYDPPLPNLCEVVVDEMLYGGGRHPDRPILSRIAYVAEIASHDQSIRDTLESINAVVSKRVNGLDPTGGMIRNIDLGDDAVGADKTPTVCTVNISGICVEFANHIICVAESEPAHLQHLMMELGKVVVPSAADKRVSISVEPISPQHHTSSTEVQYNHRHKSLQNLYIIYSVDDIVAKTSNIWAHIDASTIGSIHPVKELEKANEKGIEKNKTSQPKSDETTDRLVKEDCARLDEKIVNAIHKMLQICSIAQTFGKAKREEFYSSPANTHAELLPSLSLIEKCLKCNLCLSIDEYLAVFCTSPEVVRSSEVVYPCKPHFDYTSIMASIK